MYVRRKVAIRSFIEAGLSTYGRADSVAKEPGRIRRLVFANGLRFNCKNLTSKCTSLRLQSTLGEINAGKKSSLLPWGTAPFGHP